MAVSFIKTFPWGRLQPPFGRKPGIDFTNRATQRLVLNQGTSSGQNGGVACVATSSGMIDLISGRRGSPIGSPIFTVNGLIGPSMKSTGLTSGFSFATGAGSGSAVPTVFAAIISPTSISNGVFSTSIIANGNHWFGLADSSIGLPGRLGSTVQGVSASGSTVQLAANAPYFVMAASYGTSANGFWLARNLKTGALQVDISNATAIPVVNDTGSGVIYIGNSSNTTDGMVGYIAAAMLSAPPATVAVTPLTLADGIAWSLDPWSFWYPSNFSDFYFNNLMVGTAAAIAARVSRLLLMGAGQ